MDEITNLRLELEALQNHIALKEHEFQLQREMWKKQKVSQNVYIAHRMNDAKNIEARIKAIIEHDKILEG